MNSNSAELQSWIKNRVKKEQVDKYLDNSRDFINEEEITRELEANKNPSKERIREILSKSLEVKTLTLAETAALLAVQGKELVEEMEEAAAKVKKKVYDNRIVTFAPLYLGNLCVNNCVYCGFRKDNPASKRRVLSLDEVSAETGALAGKIGHKRLIVVYGEHPSIDLGYITSTIKTIYQRRAKTKQAKGRIRRVNVNAAPLSIEDLKVLRESGIGTYQVFQETYHRDTYKQVHPQDTIKSNYQWRLYCMHRALEAGVDDVGIGVLFGLYDWRFEVMGLAAHSRELEEKFNIGPHTISFPRLEPAHGAEFTQNLRYKVSDKDFRRLIAVIRLAVPHTGMIITARESASLRRQMIPLGCTQTDASTRIGVGSYSEDYSNQEGQRQQFIIGDTRSLDEVIREFTDMGYITSFCTAGYRCGRTGECIMGLLRAGQEGKFCKLNAILTFREWLDDFASLQTKEAGEKLIIKEMEEVKEKMPLAYPQLLEYYEKIKQGQRDLYF